MLIVIDIPEEVKNRLGFGVTYTKDIQAICEAIGNSMPLTDILNKIRAEIESHCGLVKENHCKYCSYCNSVMGVREILEIIDTYKAESRGKE